MTVAEYDDRAAWLEARRQSIGSSDVAAIFGESSWSSPYSVWCEKTGRSADHDRPEEHLEWGLRLEPVIAAKAEEILRQESDDQLSIVDPGEWAICRSEDPSLSFATATLDREVFRRGDPYAVLEIKNSSEYMEKLWREEVPLIYQLQVQWQLMVTGYEIGYVAVLIGGRSFRWAELQRDEELVRIIREHGERFWACVENDTPPKPDGLEPTRRALMERYAAGGNGSAVILTDDDLSNWQETQRLADEVKKLEARRKAARHYLIERIGDASFGNLPDGTVIESKRISSKGGTYERKPSSHIRLMEVKR